MIQKFVVIKKNQIKKSLDGRDSIASSTASLSRAYFLFRFKMLLSIGGLRKLSKEREKNQ